jgi:hypothetical protein
VPRIHQHKATAAETTGKWALKSNSKNAVTSYESVLKESLSAHNAINCPDALGPQDGPASDDDDFQMVTRKHKKDKPLVIGDNKSTTAFHGVVKKVVICVSRLNPTTTTEMVTDFLSDNGIGVISCYSLKPASNATTPKFINLHLCVSQTDAKKVYCSDLWPEGVVIRPWTFKQRSSNKLAMMLEHPAKQSRQNSLLIVICYCVSCICHG